MKKTNTNTKALKIRASIAEAAFILSNVVCGLGMCIAFLASGDEAVPMDTLVKSMACALAAMVQWLFLHDSLKGFKAKTHREMRKAVRADHVDFRERLARQEAAVAAMSDMDTLVKDFEKCVGRQGKYVIPLVKGSVVPVDSKNIVKWCEHEGYPYVSTYDGTIWFRKDNSCWATVQESVTETGEKKFFEAMPQRAN